MGADENKERTTPGEREEVRPTGSGGDRAKGRASRPDRGSTRGKRGAVAAATDAARSLLRLTPAGDAARMWLPTAIAVLMVTFVFFVVGGPFRSVHWLLGVNVLYGLMYPRFIRVDGERLRRIRQERALSLRDLGERSVVSFDSIHKLETGRRSAQPRTIRKLAEALGVEPSELMQGEE